MLHVTTQKKTGHHKKAIAVEIFVAIAMLTVFFVPASRASDITVDMVIKLVNSARTVANVATLKKNEFLQKAAEEKAEDMIRGNYFAHVSPDGKSPWHWIEENKYEYMYAGENLAMDFTNAEEQQRAWMESPSHKKNILNPNYDEIGVAIRHGVIDGKKTLVVVQMFGKQLESIVKDNPIEIKNNIAGMQAENSTGISAAQKISDKMNLNVLFHNNAPTLIGWFVLFSLAIIIVIVDVAAVFYKKHKPFFILHETKNQ